MSIEEIKKLCPKAERVTYTDDGTVGLKVGEFSQAININFQEGHEKAARQVKDLYLDLMGMNRELDAQIKEASNELSR